MASARAAKAREGTAGALKRAAFEGGGDTHEPRQNPSNGVSCSLCKIPNSL